ncbi:hypothetical protein SAMN04489724_1388 [Algoriphagus locisalis]|uniref:Uncharacterized protein n=1 Tax=Algoriphagus locisalis TaxID=305507 RepID=A0A1I6ZPP5_9BACT|nr:hypothetical protein SAMN04489724_1388 [Algoriphagus locisalis]
MYFSIVIAKILYKGHILKFKLLARIAYVISLHMS